MVQTYSQPESCIHDGTNIFPRNNKENEKNICVIDVIGY
jgi:hypothetical protein